MRLTCQERIIVSIAVSRRQSFLGSQEGKLAWNGVKYFKKWKIDWSARPARVQMVNWSREDLHVQRCKG